MTTCRATAQWKFRDHFVVGDGFRRLVLGRFAFRFGDDELPQLIVAEFQPVPPRAFRFRWPPFHVGHVFALHAVDLQLVDEMLTRGRVHRHAKHATGVLVEPMDGQRLQSAVRRRQRVAAPIDTAVVRAQFAGEEIGENIERGQVIRFRRHREQARAFVHDGERGIEIEDRNTRMNLPAVPVPQSNAVARRSSNSSASFGSGIGWFGWRRMTPLTLTRPAVIHCFARFFGVSGYLASNHSSSGRLDVLGGIACRHDSNGTRRFAGSGCSR